MALPHQAKLSQLGQAIARVYSIGATAPLLFGVMALLLLTASSAFAPTSGLPLQVTKSPDDLVAQLSAFFAGLTSHDAFSGAVLVSRSNKVLLRAGYGLADRAWNIPNTPATKFRIASITKGFTAAAIMMLQEQGKLNVKDRVCQYIERCPEAWQSITIHELLTHTAGVPDYNNLPGYKAFKVRPATLNEIVDFFRSEPLRFTPGTQWEYSNSGYIILGQVIQNVSNNSYVGFLQNRFFKPLGMANTGLEEMTTILPQQARGYKSPTQVAEYIDMSTESAAGQVYSTVDDLYRWNQAFVTGKVVTPATFTTMIEAGVSVAGNTPPFLSRYGYGFASGEYQGHALYFHAGDIYGFLSLIFYFPTDGTTVVVLGNLESIDFEQTVTGILTILYGS